MSTTPFHVVIIGGGIGGACLAQGLKKAGISVAVYERERTPTARLQGYRIHINPYGSRALHACLPPHLYEAFVSTCGKSGSGYGFYTEKMKELLFIDTDHEEQEINSIESHKSVSRITLRQVLLAELDDIVHFNKKYVRYEERSDGKITAFFEDGTSATGDILVAADGGGSRVRKQFLPHAERIDTGILNIAGKVPLTDKTRALLPKNLYAGPASIIAPKGIGMFIAVQEFENNFDHVPLSIGGNDSSYGDQSNLLFDNTKDYIMWAFIARREKYSFKKAPSELTSAELQNEVLTMIKDWDPSFHKLVQMSDTSTIIPLPIRSSVPIKHWETKNITLLGDAIHSMTPFRGIGANTALRDAELLCQNLIAAHRREKTVLQGIYDYETQMIQYGFDAVRSSMKAAQQSVLENAFGLRLMKAMFCSINAIPPLKRLIFRNFGNE